MAPQRRLMLKRLLAFSGASTVKGAYAASPLNPAEVALEYQLAERSKADLLIGVKIGGKDAFQRLLNGIKNALGMYRDSLLFALSASQATHARLVCARKLLQK